MKIRGTHRKVFYVVTRSKQIVGLGANNHDSATTTFHELVITCDDQSFCPPYLSMKKLHRQLLHQSLQSQSLTPSLAFPFPICRRRNRRRGRGREEPADQSQCEGPQGPASYSSEPFCALLCWRNHHGTADWTEFRSDNAGRWTIDGVLQQPYDDQQQQQQQ